MKQESYIMKVSQLLGERYKDRVADIESQNLMTRGGYMKQVGNGIYSLLPPAVRIQRKIEKILRDELQYLPYVSDTTYEKMLESIRDAGGDRVKRELQRQLDEWFAENPQWKELCSLNKTEN